MQRFRIPELSGPFPRILLIGQDYFILPELERAMVRLGISHVVVDFRQEPEFLKELFETAGSFRPDFILTVNHAGLDAEGQVLDLLRKCGIPLASWFVDKHDMFLRTEVDAETLLAVFIWDPDGVKPVAEYGVAHVRHLPLATDPVTFSPAPKAGSTSHKTAFVGSSWRKKIADNLRTGDFSAVLLEQYEALGERYEHNPQVDLGELMNRHAPEAFADLKRLSHERQTQYGLLLQLEATRLRRLKCVERLLPMEPAIVGSEYWKTAFVRSGFPFIWYGRMHYERELPGFYQRVIINFNTTSLQSVNAVNQRLFDVPVCGAFVLTDRTSGIEELFEPGKEVVCYESVEDIRPLAERWIADESGRKRIICAARERILAEHTYEHRLVTIMRDMKRYF